MFNDISSALRPALVLTLLFALLLGLAYPLALTGLAQAIFPDAANGSLIERGGHVVGSRLIGQSFSAPGYFHPRPSAAGTGYDAMASSGSNLGPASKALADRVGKDVAALGLPSGSRVPADMVTTSASGLDPHISPDTAQMQVGRVAGARGIARERIAALVRENTGGPLLGFLGEPRVNVLELNLALDKLAQGSARPTR